MCVPQKLLYRIKLCSLHVCTLLTTIACEPGEDVTTKPVDLAIVTNFIPKMAQCWDTIGIQLKQQDLVKELRRSPDARTNCMQVFEAAIASECPLNYGTLFDILRSNGVCLPHIVPELKLAVVRQSQREAEHLLTAVSDYSDHP